MVDITEYDELRRDASPTSHPGPGPRREVEEEIARQGPTGTPPTSCSPAPRWPGATTRDATGGCTGARSAARLPARRTRPPTSTGSASTT